MCLLRSAFLIVCFLLWMPSAHPQSPPPPNVIIFLADDLGYGELGCQGNTEIPTPHIDALAQNGIRFTHAYVTAPVCSPSRAGLLTGLYQQRFGYTQNLIGAENEDPTKGMDTRTVTLAEHLKNAGYVSAIIGKWHLGGTARYHPQRQGFDEFFGFLHEGHFFVPPPYTGTTTMLRRKVLPNRESGRWFSPDSTLIFSDHLGRNEPPYDINNPILRGSQPHREPQYLTDAFTREAIDFIDRHSQQPFFLYLSYNAVHSPLQAPNSYLKKFSYIKDIHRRIFAAMLSNLDASVGAVMNKLRLEGLEENTLVIFLSDNGGPTKELTSSNLPLRGGKGSLYEGGIRIPFLMQWKNHLAAGAIFEKPIISLDIFPTVAHIAQLPAEYDTIDGVNLMPFLLKEVGGPPHHNLFWSYRNKSAVRSGPWKLVSSTSSWNGEAAPWSLYNLEKDMGETSDLASKYPKKVEELIALWEYFNTYPMPFEK